MIEIIKLTNDYHPLSGSKAELIANKSFSLIFSKV